MTYKLTPTTANNFDDLKRFVNEQFQKISTAINNQDEGVKVTKGTWTPSYSLTNGSVSQTTQVGKWIKIDDLMFIEGKIQLSAASTSGTLQIIGMPEPAKTGHEGIFSFHYENFSSLYAGLTGYIAGSVLHVREQNATGTENPILTNNSLIRFTGFYRV